ncbi:hypothetical protein ASZ90_018591 [hydrocarbon metagenome]|uniref:Uncharacterized protein n=1 Tax=hydrocarbon metagenome TaxID=938273 RepID=A0A0W8E5V3_9ZZZZ
MTAVTLEKFKDLPREQQVAIHEEMKNTIGVDGILKKWGLTRSKYYYMVRKLKLNDQKQDENVRNEKSESSAVTSVTTDGIAPLAVEETRIPRLENREKMSFSLTIQESPEVVNVILKSLEDMLHTSNSDFNVNINIREV